MKTKHFGVAKTTDRPVLVRAGKRVGGIEHQFEVVFMRDPNMDAHAASYAQRDQILDFGRVNIMSKRIHVAVDQGDLLPLQGMLSSNHSKVGTITSPCNPNARAVISRATVALLMTMQCRTPRAQLIFAPAPLRKRRYCSGRACY
jgi:hypothetical protein